MTLCSAALLLSFPTLSASLMPSSAALQRLSRGGPGYAVVENFLSPDSVALLKKDVAVLQSEGRFRVAGVGEASTNRVADDVRRAEQCFLYPRAGHGGGGHAEARSMLYTTVDTLRQELQRETQVKLDGLLTEGLYAAYPRGGFYRRHVDSYANTPQVRHDATACVPDRH